MPLTLSATQTERFPMSKSKHPNVIVAFGLLFGWSCLAQKYLIGAVDSR